MSMPKWVSANRQNELVRLFVASKGFCVFGHENCQIPEHHYELFIDGLIKDWVNDDRASEAQAWKAERKLLHQLGEHRYPIRGQFSAIAKDIFFEHQPLYHLIGLGINGLTFKPFAKVRISSSYIVLYVDLGDVLKDISKNQRRKAVRYSKSLPVDVTRKVEKLVSLAVADYQRNN